jgi:hypothetical protein
MRIKINVKYTLETFMLTSNLMVLAIKAYQANDMKAAARFFATACSCSDHDTFIKSVIKNDRNISVSSSELRLSDIQISSNRVLSAIEDSLESDGPMSVSELNYAVRTIKKTRASNEFTMDITEDDPDEEYECPDCESYPCVCEFESSDVHREHSVATLSYSELVEAVKNAMIALKVRSNDWESKKYIPKLIKILPDLASGNGRDAELIDVVNGVLNRLHKINEKILKKLHKAVKPLLLG